MNFRRYCFAFSTKKNHVFIEEGNPPEKVVMTEEKLDGIDIDDLGNLENSRRLVFIDEECGDLK